MIVIDADRCAEALPFDRLIAALARQFRAGCRMPERHVHEIAAAPGEPKAQGGTVLIMPAWNDGGLLGIKTVNVFPGNALRGLPGLHATYALFDAATGVPLATLDGNVITIRRTAATSALAASRLLAPRFRDGREPVDLLVVGSGRVARWLPHAFAAVATLGHVRVWNHRPQGARALAGTWKRDGLRAASIEAVETLEPAVRASTLVSCATLATEPIVRAEWLAPDSHLDLIGSFSPGMREAAPECFAAADVWVDVPEASRKAGDLLDAFARGSLAPTAIAGTIDSLVDGDLPHHRPSRRTVFKAVGSAQADLAAATLIWQDVVGD